MRKILLIDGYNNFIRNYVINPSLNANGDPIGGAIGFLKNLREFFNVTKSDLCIVVWDGKGGSAKRRSIYSEYKAGRKVKLNREYDFETVDDSMRNMSEQQELLSNFLTLVGVNQIRVDSCEADDVIAYITSNCFDDDQKIIISTDRDFYQLVSEKTVVYNPIKKHFVDSNYIKANIKILPANFIILKSLVGDKSDNIKGIKGLGEKTVVKLFPFLLEKESTIYDVFNFCENSNKEKVVKSETKYSHILENKDLVVENYKLMQLASTIISTQASRSIRAALEKDLKQNLFDLKLCLMKNGIQNLDNSFFSSIKEYYLRYKIFSGENDGSTD